MEVTTVTTVAGRHLPWNQGIHGADPWWTGPSWKRDKCVSVFIYHTYISYNIYIYIYPANPCNMLLWFVMYVVIPCNSRIIQSSHQQVWHMCVCNKVFVWELGAFFKWKLNTGETSWWVHLDAGCCALTITWHQGANICRVGKEMPRMSANSTTNALGHGTGSATTGMRLRDNLSHVIESANLTLLSGHSLNIAKNWRLLIYSSSNRNALSIFSDNLVSLMPAARKSFKACGAACRRSDGCSRNTSARSLGVLGNSTSGPLWNTVAKYVSAKMVSGKIFSALIPSYVDTTSSNGAVLYAPIRAVSATRLGFKPKPGNKSIKYFAARCWVLPKPQQARMADVKWYI